MDPSADEVEAIVIVCMITVDLVGFVLEPLEVDAKELDVLLGNPCRVLPL